MAILELITVVGSTDYKYKEPIKFHLMEDNYWILITQLSCQLSSYMRHLQFLYFYEPPNCILTKVVFYLHNLLILLFFFQNNKILFENINRFVKSLFSMN